MDQPVLTPELLLTLTKELKSHQVSRCLKKEDLSSKEIVVTEEEIYIMGHTLKFHVFFVTPSIMQEAVRLAKTQGCLKTF